MTLNLYKQKISVRVALVILLSSLFIAVLFSIFNYYSIHKQQLKFSHRAIQQLVIVVNDTASIASYLDNAELAHDVVNGLIKNDMVSFAQIISNKGLNETASIDDFKKIDADSMTNSERFVLYSPFDSSEIVGHLIVVPNSLFIEENTKQAVLQQSIYLVIYTVLIGLFVFFHMNIIFITPLEKIIINLDRINPGSDQRVNYVKGHVEGELGKLTKYLNLLLKSMQKTLSSEHHLLIQAENLNNDLQQANLEIKGNQLLLEHARTDAINANQAKSDFLANMSHEIRTPMNAVIGFTELMQNTSLDQKQNQYLESIKLGSKSLLRLINDVLDLSKIEAGKITLEYDVVNLYSLIDELEQVFATNIKEKNLKYYLEVDQSVSNGLYLDETRLRQILFNLIGNAIKFTQSGSISVKVSQNIDANNKANLYIVVEDTGIGIPEQQFDKIFNSFEQQDGQSTRKFGGTGLGLSISKRLVEMMNGTIEVSSEENKGSSFHVNLKSIEIGEKLENHSSTNIYHFKPTKILIVDDDNANLLLLSEILAVLGFETVQTSNGQEAIHILEHTAIDLVLMDLNMPILNGYEAIEIIREHEKLKDLPVFAISASVMRDEKTKAIKSGFTLFIEKPIAQQRLIDALSTVLEHEYDEDQTVELETEGLKISDELVQELKANYLQRCENALSSGLFESMSELANEINQVALSNNNASLTLWAEHLQQAIDNFDIELINKNFELFILKLKS